MSSGSPPPAGTGKESRVRLTPWRGLGAVSPEYPTEENGPALTRRFSKMLQ